MLLIKVVHAGAHFEIEDTPYEDEVGLIISRRARRVTHT